MFINACCWHSQSSLSRRRDCYGRGSQHRTADTPVARKVAGIYQHLHTDISTCASQPPNDARRDWLRWLSDRIPRRDVSVRGFRTPGVPYIYHKEGLTMTEETPNEFATA